MSSRPFHLPPPALTQPPAMARIGTQLQQGFSVVVVSAVVKTASEDVPWVGIGVPQPGCRRRRRLGVADHKKAFRPSAARRGEREPDSPQKKGWKNKKKEKVMAAAAKRTMTTRQGLGGLGPPTLRLIVRVRRKPVERRHKGLLEIRAPAAFFPTRRVTVRCCGKSTIFFW